MGELTDTDLGGGSVEPDADDGTDTKAGGGGQDD